MPRFNNYTAIIKPSILNNSFIYVSPPPPRPEKGRKKGRNIRSSWFLETFKLKLRRGIHGCTITISAYTRVYSYANKLQPELSKIMG